LDDDKKKPKKHGSLLEYEEGEGEAWGFACFKRYSYFFAAFALGNWSKETRSRLMQQLKERVRAPTNEEHLVIYSDGNDAYQATLPLFFDTELIDYAKLIKILVKGRVVDKIREVVFGEPFINRVHTNNIENTNGILRNSVSHLVRKTKCIAKKRTELEARLQLFQFHWNFMHETATRGSDARRTKQQKMDVEQLPTLQN
jgi:IS1 family transposase